MNPKHQREDGAPRVPNRLLTAIQDGECVAFLGSGFSAAAGLPTWTALLQSISESPDVGGAERVHVAECIASGTASALDEAAQLLQDVLGTSRFSDAVAELLRDPVITPAMQTRLECIRSIPFRAILTTNFDPVLDGLLPSQASYRSVLRPQGLRWWDDRFWDDDRGSAPVLKLHGDIEVPKSIVLTRRDYRRRLYGDPDYMAFLRSVLSRYTVLYLGFSFVDAYLNELRSQALSLLGIGSSDDPVAYAVINDASKLSQAHYRRHEGVEVLSYSTTDDPCHEGFNHILGALRRGADPVYRFGRLVSGMRILWVDRTPANNAPAYRFLRRAAALDDSRGTCVIEEALNVKSAVERLSEAKASDQQFDLVISHWGRRSARGASSQPSSVAEKLLSSIKELDLRVPVLIFSTAAQATQRKKASLRLGAQGYFFSYEGLLRGIEGVLSDGRETG